MASRCSYPRSTTKVSVDWPADRPRQRQLYDDVTAYVRDGYDLGRREKNNSLIFLMLLMQRLVSSSTRAIEVALERRLVSLQAEEERLKPPEPPGQLGMDPDFWEVDANEQLELVFERQLPAMRNERATVERLVRLAGEAQQEGIDAKLERLYDLLVGLAREENDPLVKVLVFTEFLPTQALIVDYLRSMGVETAVLNGDHVDRGTRGGAGSLRRVRHGSWSRRKPVARASTCRLRTSSSTTTSPGTRCASSNVSVASTASARLDRSGRSTSILRGSVEDRVHDVLEEKLAADPRGVRCRQALRRARQQRVRSDVPAGLRGCRRRARCRRGHVGRRRGRGGVQGRTSAIGGTCSAGRCPIPRKRSGCAIIRCRDGWSVSPHP